MYLKSFGNISNASKKRSTITTVAFKVWTERNVEQCHICDRIRLLQKRILETQKIDSSGHNIFFFLIVQIKSNIPAGITLHDVNKEG